MEIGMSGIRYSFGADEHIFAEIKVSQFLRAVGLSVPRELPSASA